MPALTYRLCPAQPRSHRLRIEFDVPAAFSSQARHLCLAAWTPGSYKIRDYARHLLGLTLRNGAGQALTVTPVDKHSWELPADPAGWRLELEFYAREDSVRGAFLNGERGLFDGAGIFPRLDGLEDEPLDLEILPPPGTEGWRVATAMPADEIDVAGWGRYTCADWWELIDHPIGMGEFTRLEFEAEGIPHGLAIFGAADTDHQALGEDLTAVCSEHVRQMGEAPHDRYLFLLRLGAGGDGGLEHRWSSTLAADRRALPRRLRPRNRDYRSFLGLVSHEYFHLWNVKRMRPQRLAASHLDAEAYTEDLWVYEGVTSYLDDYTLRRAGLLSVEEYLGELARSLTRLALTPGRFRQSLAQSSRDAWIRLYQGGEHLPYSTVSYYLKGALVALALDLTLRLASDGATDLPALMRAIWQRYREGAEALPERCLEETAAALPGLSADLDLPAFFERYVRGTEDPDFAALLQPFGVLARCRPPSGLDDPGGASNEPAVSVDLGVRLAPDALAVTAVDPDSAAQNAGLQPGDTLLAWNGERLTRARLESRLRTSHAGEHVSLHWFSDERLASAELSLPPAAENRWVLAPDPAADSSARARRAAWLGAE